MSGSEEPKTCCDYGCAAVNGCAVGGVQCESCGRWFCVDDLDADGYCDRCAEERAEEEDGTEAEEEE